MKNEPHVENVSNPVCQVCGMDCEQGNGNIVACASCGAPHHSDCWEYTGMCSTYGCGGIVVTKLDFSELTQQRVLMTISEDTRSPLALGTFFESNWRRIKTITLRSYYTIKAGCLGGGVVALGYYLLYGYRHSFWRVFPSICMGLAIAVIIYGFLSSLLASIYHRYSLETSIVSGALFFLAFHFMDLTTGHWSSMLPQAMAAALSAMVFASATAETLFGRFTHWGRRLEAQAEYLRYLVTFLAFAAITSLGTYVIGLLNFNGPIQEIAMWSILATVMGGRSVEAGKEEYRKKLIAQFDDDEQ